MENVSQQQGRTESSWVCTDNQGNQSEVIGLGTAWSCTDIFKDNSKQLPKNAQEAKDREHSLEDSMYNDLAKASG